MPNNALQLTSEFRNARFARFGCIRLQLNGLTPNTRP